MFQDILAKALDHVAHANACILMGFDGIPIASVNAAGERAQDGLMAMAVELANLVGTLHRSSVAAEMGTVRELSVQTERFTALAHIVMDEYVLVLSVGPEADLARGARMLRLLAPMVEGQM